MPHSLNRPGALTATARSWRQSLILLSGLLVGGIGIAAGCEGADPLDTQPDNAGDAPRDDGSAHDAGRAQAVDARVVLPIGNGPTPDDAGSSLPVDGSTTSAGAEAGLHDAQSVSCDERKVLCRRARPVCPDQRVPTVVETCWGECVPIDQCACKEADECPQRDTYVCHMSAAHCGPYVN